MNAGAGSRLAPGEAGSRSSNIASPEGRQMHLLVPQARAASRNAASDAASLYTCWASSARDIRAAQSLRRSVFFDEMGGRPATADGATDSLDVDHFDAFCDHLLIKARDASGSKVRSLPPPNTARVRRLSIVLR